MVKASEDQVEAEVTAASKTHLVVGSICNYPAKEALELDIVTVRQCFTYSFKVQLTDEDFVKDLVETRHKADLFVNHLVVAVQDPHGNRLLFDGADIRVGTEQDVFELRLLLVNLLDTLETQSKSNQSRRNSQSNLLLDA